MKGLKTKGNLPSQAPAKPMVQVPPQLLHTILYNTWQRALYHLVSFFLALIAAFWFTARFESALRQVGLMEFGPREDGAGGAAWRPSSETPQREMQDTCLFLHVVKDGNARRLVRRLDQAQVEETDFDDTASWESWRSGFDSCAGRESPKQAISESVMEHATLKWEASPRSFPDLKRWAEMQLSRQVHRLDRLDRIDRIE